MLARWTAPLVLSLGVHAIAGAALSLTPAPRGLPHDLLISIDVRPPPPREAVATQLATQVAAPIRTAASRRRALRPAASPQPAPAIEQPPPSPAPAPPSAIGAEGPSLPGGAGAGLPSYGTSGTGGGGGSGTPAGSPSGAGTGNGSGGGSSAYESGARDAILSQQRYPRAARRMGLQGEVTVFVTIDRSGGLVHPPRVIRSSGHPILDAEAVRMVEAAAPFNPLPPDWPAPQVDLQVPIRFRLTR